MYAASAQSIYISINKSTLHISKVWLRTDCINKNTAAKFNKKTINNHRTVPPKLATKHL